MSVDIDISLSNIQKIYEVKNTYKSKQKASNSRIIPFEAIDKDIYKANANCACFITSEKRIHAWIAAVAELIFVAEGKNEKNMFNWIDKKDNTDKIVQTHFILTDKTKEILEDDNFIYKIIVYLTTGKIMIQGKH